MANWETAHGIRLRELDKVQSLSGKFPSLEISFNENELAEFKRQLANFPNIFAESLFLAADQARRKLQGEIRKGLRSVTTLQPAYITRAVRSKRAIRTGGGVQAEVRVASKRLPLIRYDVTPDSPPQLKGLAVSARQRVKYKLRKGGATYNDQPKETGSNLSSLFVQSLRSGHTGVFYRQGGNSGGLQEEYGPPIQYHMYAEGFLPHIEESGRQLFLRSLASELRAQTGIEVKL